MSEKDKRIEELERLAVENSKVVTCVFCGQHYPAGTESWGERVLLDHIKKCPAHPLKFVIDERDLLRDRIDVAITALDKKDYKQCRLILERAIVDTAHQKKGDCVLMNAEASNGS